MKKATEGRVVWLRVVWGKRGVGSATLMYAPAFRPGATARVLACFCALWPMQNWHWVKSKEMGECGGARASWGKRAL